MANLLKSRLKELAEQNEDLAVLSAQWAFDEKLVEKSLNAISNVFPHFSLHDASHSKQILINIERLLGENGIAQLSATDVWLLLESAYWHDIGMVVPHIDQLTAEQSSDFSDLVETIKADPTHDLHEFCSQLDLTQHKPWLRANQPITVFLQQYNELMAEYFRKKHAARSSEIVLNPVDAIGLGSPRNSLIPKRLFSTLSQICFLHGSDFSEIEARLPHRINGIGNDDCHPRFAACMLRLGDLLDIDDNRFCPTLKLMCGDNRPTLSKTHEKKHAAIRDFSISPREINIRAMCEDEETYYETYQWFEWLKDEHKLQLLNWSSIAPDEKAISLPSSCKAEVKINGNQIILEAGRRQVFSIDGQEALHLLGVSLYPDRLLAIREIIQNAIDATAIKAWLEISDKDKEFYRSRDDFIKAYRHFNEKVITEYPITITAQENDGLEIQIQDQGTGISRNDIQYLINVATSKNNKQKNSIIKDMPDWMRPSGNFGVGFQSIFNITDSVEVISKCYFTNSRTKIKADNPRGGRKGKVVVTELEPVFNEPSGTIVKFYLNEESVNQIGSKTKFRTENEFDKERNHFLDKARFLLDPLKDNAKTDKHLRIAAELIGQTYGVSNNLHFNLMGSENLSSRGFSGTPFISTINQYFEIKVYPNLFQPGVSIFYRGAPVQNLKLNGMLLSVELNILCGTAREWITPDRKQLRQEKYKALDKTIVEFIKEYPNHLFKQQHIDQKNQEQINFAASLALDHFSLDENIDLSRLLNEQRDAYLKYELPTNKGEKTLEALLTENELVLTHSVGHKGDNIEASLQDSLIISPTGINDEVVLYLQQKLLKKNFCCRRHFFTHDNLRGGDLLLLKRSQTIRELETHLSNHLSSYLMHITKNRTLFACIAISENDPEFKNLTISKIDEVRDRIVKKIPLIHIVDFDLYHKEPVKWVVLPFIFKRGLKSSSAESIDVADYYKLAETVSEFLDIQISTSELASLYQNLVIKIDNRMNQSPFADEWRKLRENERL